MARKDGEALIPARWEDLISGMVLVDTQMTGLFDLNRLLTIDTIRRDSSGEMDRSALLRRYQKIDLRLKPAPRLPAESTASTSLARIRKRRPCGGSLGDACQARRAPRNCTRLSGSFEGGLRPL